MPKHAAAHSLEPSTKSVALPKELSEMAEMLKSQDVAVIDQAVEAWADFAAIKPEAADKLLAKVGVYSDGNWDQGPRFSRNDEDKQKALSYALLSLLSRAPAGTRGAYLRENIRKLEVITPEIPELLGFTGLQSLDLRIEPDKAIDAGVKLDWQERVSKLPSLQKLKLFVPDKKRSPGSLRAFESSQLERVDIYDENLDCIEGLEKSKKLHTVHVSRGYREVHPENSVLDLAPLVPSLDSLNELNFYGCPVKDLAPISGCKDLRVIKISHAKIKSAKDMPIMNGRSLEIPNSITSLEGIERQTKIKELRIHGGVNEGLELISGLSNLESLCISFGSKALPDLTGLTGLKCLEIFNQSLEALPTQWPPAIKELDIEHCCNVVSLGVLPPSLEGLLDLSQFSKLETLDGIQVCTRLNEAKVTLRCKDISAAAALPDLWLTLILKGGNSPSDLPPEWVEQLAAMPSCKLRPVIYRSNSLRELTDLNAFASIPGLKALDLSNLGVRDPSAILRMEKLEYLQVQPRSDLSRKFGAITISGQDKIAALRLKLMALG